MGILRFGGISSPDAETEDGMVTGLQSRDMNQLTNNEKTPIITVGGCHSENST